MPSGAPLKERFRALKDVSVLDLGPGDQVRLEPGESLTLEPFIAHAFWAEGGAAVAGEVSLANDDTTDNYFVPPLEPFPLIEEDAPARYVTVEGPRAALRRALLSAGIRRGSCHSVTASASLACRSRQPSARTHSVQAVRKILRRPPLLRPYRQPRNPNPAISIAQVDGSGIDPVGVNDVRLPSELTTEK